ncbi:hypothetical protein ACFWHR_07625 [Leucobacter sp. NPDC058333]|uniref:hypothetical protein n=1 Tax=Leucobacter sp. NPDC058333 TaxID=3346450 RepID=UPI0036539E9D
MSYWTQAKLASDHSLTLRVHACALNEGIPDPSFWAQQQAWNLSAQPGWDDAYEYALTTDNPDPGADETVITDGMILAAVQALRTKESPPAPPEPSPSPAE